MQTLIRWLAILQAWPVFAPYFKRKTYYVNKKSQGRFVKGGALIVSNHYHVFDYFVNVFLFPFRKLHVVMAEMVFRKGKFFRWVMDCFGGICSDRDVMGMKFIDDSVRVLKKGGLVQIYPEAHISKNGEMLPFKPSYIMIALRANVPIIPVITDGNYGFFKRVHLLIGEKIYLSDYCSSLNPSREEIMELNQMVQQKAQQMKEDLDARVAAKRKK